MRQFYAQHEFRKGRKGGGGGCKTKKKLSQNEVRQNMSARECSCKKKGKLMQYEQNKMNSFCLFVWRFFLVCGTLFSMSKSVIPLHHLCAVY